jgi:chromosome segregation ATPase
MNSGVRFAADPDVPPVTTGTGVQRTMVSEEITPAQAARFLQLPGFLPCTRTPDDLARIDAAIAAQRLIPTGESASALALQTIDEAHTANRAMSTELTASKNRVRELEAQLQAAGGVPDERIAELEANLERAKTENERLQGDVRRLTDENTSLRETNRRLGGDELTTLQTRVQALEADKATLAQEKADLNAQLEDLTKPKESKDESGQTTARQGRASRG